MGYFHLLELQQEPFSNAPDPDFFYLSAPHRDCLQQIELSLRLRRGLNLVLGEVGAGKTTLCRHLYAAFSKDPTIRMVFVPDPAFRDVRAFLWHVATGLGLSGLESEDDLKEALCDFFLKEAGEKGRIIVFLLDEAQKLKPDIAEVLREFLNFETNHQKLVQMALVGQPELLSEKRLPENFMDRVHLCHLLKPLGFRDTCGLIRHRLRMAGREDAGLFSLAALWGIYRKSGGHPRKIIHLCHHTLLLLLVQNRKKAGWQTVGQAAKRLPLGLKGKVHPAFSKKGGLLGGLLVLNLLLLSALGYAVWGQSGRAQENGQPQVARVSPPSFSDGETGEGAPEDNGKAGETEKGGETADPARELKEGSSVKNDPVKKEVVKKDPEEGSPQEGGREEASPPPALLGSLVVQPGDMATDMIWRMYGVSNPLQVKALAAANPRIRNLNRLRPGERLFFPAQPLASQPRYPFFLLYESEALSDAWKALKKFDAEDLPLRLIAFWREDLGLRFRIVPNACFKDWQALEAWQLRLKDVLEDGEAPLPRSWETGLVFYADPELICTLERRE